MQLHPLWFIFSPLGFSRHVRFRNTDKEAQAIVSFGGSRAFVIVLVSCGCYSKLPQTQWLKQIYCLIILEVRSFKIRVLIGCIPSGDFWGKSVSLSFPLWEAAFIPWLVAPALHLQGPQCTILKSLCLCFSLTSACIIIISFFDSCLTPHKVPCDYIIPPQESRIISPW